MRSRRVGFAAVVAAAVMVALAGCSGIPTSGPVHQGAAVVVAQDAPVTQSIAQPPRHDAAPLEIVQGFLFASASFDNDHAVAREFLAPDVAKTWNPLAGTTVYQIDPTTGGFRQNGPAEIDLAATTLGQISPQGEYVDAPDNSALAWHFKLRQVAGGQWRIETPPKGLLLTAADRDRNYRVFDVYFPDPSFQVLVPNQILVPVGRGTSTALVKAVLAGPTSWLAPAVTTAVPTGTKLIVDSAPVVNGVVQVALTSAAASSTPTHPVVMSAQLVWTLRQLASDGVTGVQITVGGIPLRGVPQTQDIDSWPQFDPDGQIPVPSAVFSTDKGLGLLASDKPHAVPGAVGAGSLALHQPGLSFDERRVAGLDADAHKLYVADITTANKASAPVVATATHLTAPSWDRFGMVWTADARPTGLVVWTDQPGSAAKQVAVTDVPAGRVLAMRIARDGVRVVMVVRAADGTAGVYLGRVVRSDSAVTLSGFRPVSTPLTDVADVAWLSSDRLVVLGRQAPGGTQEPLTIDLAGSSVSSLGPIASSAESSPGIVSVTAAPNQEILVSTTDSKIYRYLAVGWALIGDGANPSYPG
jgi:Lipoprotein LpqB beta-propeller domain/Sporulation and spore germination